MYEANKLLFSMERSEDENEIYFAAYPTKSGSGLRYWGTSRSLVAVRVEGTRSDCGERGSSSDSGSMNFFG